jgi:predicted PurR-regulated permease PerM
MLLFHRMDHQIHQYFRGMFLLTLLDTVTLGAGLWAIGQPYGILGPSHAFYLGLACAILSWLPYLGSIIGLLLVLLVCATEAPQHPVLLLSASTLFLVVRLADDFVYSPMTVGKSLNIHPLLTVVMIFVGGSIAGIPGLFLVLPVLGICSVIGEVFEQVWFDEYLRARHAHANNLRKQMASESLK